MRTDFDAPPVSVLDGTASVKVRATLRAGRIHLRGPIPRKLISSIRPPTRRQAMPWKVLGEPRTT